MEENQTNSRAVVGDNIIIWEWVAVVKVVVLLIILYGIIVSPPTV